jgi:hypothetical protein
MKDTAKLKREVTRLKRDFATLQREFDALQAEFSQHLQIWQGHKARTNYLLNGDRLRFDWERLRAEFERIRCEVKRPEKLFVPWRESRA